MHLKDFCIYIGFNSKNSLLGSFFLDGISFFGGGRFCFLSHRKWQCGVTLVEGGEECHPGSHYAKNNLFMIVPCIFLKL